jgi:uncharacterized protein YdhG (YjbR/CyaY superfamily)
MKGEKSRPTTIDEYISRLPDDVQQIVVKIRALINESAPGVVEKISYGMAGFYLSGNGLVWFGVWKSHIGFYPRSSEMDASIKELSAYKGTKGSVHFLLNQPMPYELIRKIVEFRVAENLKS